MQQQQQVAVESEKACSGYGTFPRGGVCYSGAFLVESLYARVVTQGAHHGYVNMKAVWLHLVHVAHAKLLQL